MTDNDALIRAFEAEIRADVANAHAAAAADSRDRVRADVRRLEQEIAIIGAIAHDVWASLLELDSSRARQVSGSLTARYERYRETQGFPNIIELLAKFGAR